MKELIEKIMVEKHIYNKNLLQIIKKATIIKLKIKFEGDIL